MAIEKVETGEKTWQPPPGTEDDAFAEIDLDQKNPEESVTLVSPRAEAEETGAIARNTDEETEVERKFLDRNKAVVKRMRRQERQFNQQLADIQAENQRTIARLSSEMEQLRTQRAPASVDEAAHEAKMAQLNRDYVAALEAGDSVKAGSLMMEISRTHTAHEASKLALLLQQQKPQQAAPVAQQRTAPVVTGPTPTAKRWIRANEEWFNDPEFRAETTEAKAIDDDLIAEGSDPNSKEHYEELQARLAEKFPDLEVSDPFAKRQVKATRTEEEIDDEEDQEQERASLNRNNGVSQNNPRRMQSRRPLVPNIQDRGARTNTGRLSNRRETISTAEAAEMRKYKLDPTKDTDVRAWVRSRKETDGVLAAGGRR